MSEIKIVFDTNDGKSSLPKLYVDGVQKRYMAEIALHWTTANAWTDANLNFCYKNYEINEHDQHTLEEHVYSNDGGDESMNKKETEEYFMRMSDGIDLCHTDNDLTPAHYNAEVDTIEYIHMHRGLSGVEEFCIGNILKYATRYGKKDEKIKEIEKIIVYANRLKEIVENENE